MFDSVTLRGLKGSILWGYNTAASVKSWTIQHHRPDGKHDGRWTLKANLERVEKFQIRQSPLLFTAPRDKGQWCWPLKDIQVGATTLVATLGPPEQ